MSALSRLRELFLDPTNAYRHLCIIHDFMPGNAVLWELDKGAAAEGEYKGVISKRLRELEEWGFGGVVANVGAAGYLENEEQWKVFLAGARATKELGLRMWIYDEEGYPSGGAGGIVLRDHPEYEAQGLTRMQESFESGEVGMRPPSGWLYAVRVEADYGNGRVEEITGSVAADGWLRFDAAGECTVTRFDARRAYEGTHACRNVHQFRRYVNVLQKEAIDCFYEVTAQQYLDRLGDDACAIEAVFTDEPSFMTSYFHDLPEVLRGKVPVIDEVDGGFDMLAMVPWEKSLASKFARRWGYDALPELNRLFEGDSARDLRVRHDFYQVQSEVCAESFYANQQARLAGHGIAFSGHALGEESLPNHVCLQGNLIANLKQMGIPGADMLCSVPETILESVRMLGIKYVSSAAHTAGREQVMCESSEFEEHVNGQAVSIEQRRGAVAVQMALGVTTITSYFPWQAIEPEARRQTLDFWARLAAVLRHGTHVADFAVLYPIRTGWSQFVPMGEILNHGRLDEPLRSMDANLLAIARAIQAEGKDFDFIDTRDLINSTTVNSELAIAGETYPILLIPPGSALCPKDIEKLEGFVGGGGKVIAFEPLSDIAIPEIPNPPTGEDIGPGQTPAEVISTLASQAPDRVKVLAVEGPWMDFARKCARDDVKIELSGTHMLARRSVYDNTDFVLIVNGGGEPATARVDFGGDRTAEVWDPWSAKVANAECGGIGVRVEAYSAVVVASCRRSGSGRTGR